MEPTNKNEATIRLIMAFSSATLILQNTGNDIFNACFIFSSLGLK